MNVAAQKTASGIFLPSSTTATPLPEATVIAVGPGAPNKEGDIADPTVDESGVADDATTAGMSSPHVSTFGDGSGNGAPSKEGKEGGRPRRPTRGVEPFEKWERDEMERLLGELNGHLGESWWKPSCHRC